MYTNTGVFVRFGMPSVFLSPYCSKDARLVSLCDNYAASNYNAVAIL